MDELKLLLEITGKKGAGKVRLLSSGDFKNSKLQQLFDGLSDGSITDNIEARGKLFNNTNVYNRLTNLKNELRDNLYNLMFTIPGKYEDEKLNQVRDECNRNYALVKKLMNDGERVGLAIEIAKRTLKKSSRYQLTEMVFLLSKELMMLCAVQNEKGWRFYQKICKDAAVLLHAETQAWFVLAEIFSYTSRMRQLSNNQKRELIEKINLFDKEYASFKSYPIQIYRYNTQIFGHLLKEDVDQVCQIANEALAYFKSLPFKASKKAHFSMHYKLIPVYIIREDFINASKAVEACISYSSKGSHNWHIAMIYKAITAFHAKEYAVAEAALAVAEKYPMVETLKEQWRIIEAYLFFFDKLGKVKLRKRFRLSKFLNEVPTFSKDKEGANIAILIAQLLIFLSNNKKGKIIDRLDGLHAYSYKYLKKNYTYRSNCFIKILTQLSMGHFHKVAFERKAKPFVNKLKKRKLQINAIERELVPFLHLYQAIVELLDNKTLNEEKTNVLDLGG